MSTVAFDPATIASGLVPLGPIRTPRDEEIRARCSKIEKRLSAIGRLQGAGKDPNLALFACDPTECWALVREWIALYHEYHGIEPRS